MRLPRSCASSCIVASLFRFEFKVPNFTFFYRDIYNDSVFILQIILQTFFFSLISSFLFYIIREQIYRFMILFFIVIFVRKREYFLIKNKILLISNYVYSMYRDISRAFRDLYLIFWKRNYVKEIKWRYRMDILKTFQKDTTRDK